MTSLHLAAQSGKLDVVKYLLQTRKIDVNIRVRVFEPTCAHGGLLCIAFCLSVCIKNSLEKNPISKSIVPRVMKFGTGIDLDDLECQRSRSPGQKT